MTWQVHSEIYGEVPLLIVRPPGSAACLPTVLWFHGFGATKEVHLTELKNLAGRGLLAVGIDAPAHGRRCRADLEQQFSGMPGDNPQLFRQIVDQAIGELPGLIDQLVARGLTDQERVAVAGVSMGGCIVYGAIAAEPRLRAAAALLGSPAWVQPESEHPALARFHPTALLSITAGQDTVIPPAAAHALHRRLAHFYREQPERLGYQEMAGAAHFMSAQEWASAVGQACAWLTRFLS